MSFPSYYPIIPISYVENPIIVDDNQAVGYKWYQSSPSSDVLVASPYPCGCQTSFFQNPVSNPNLYYPVEYRPPLASHSNHYYYPSHVFHSTEPPPSLSSYHTTTHSAHQLFVTSPEGNYVLIDETLSNTHKAVNSPSSLTLTCHTTLSTGQPYYALESTTPVTPITAITDSPELMDSPSDASSDKGNQWEDKLTQMIAIIEKMQDNFTDESNWVDKCLERKSTPVNKIVNGVELNNHVDDSVVLKIFSKSQNSSSFVEYVELFMDNVSRVESAFGRKFQDDLLCYSFVVGLRGEIRETLELWAPRTLQEAIYLAKFQELLLEESLLVNNAEMKSDKGLKDLELQVETMIDKNDGVKKLSRGVYGGEKQMGAEVMPAIVNNKVGELVDTPVDNVDGIVIVPICISDLQKQTTKDWIMQIIKEPTITTIACWLGMKSSNIGEENWPIFDPGGDVRNTRLACVHNLFQNVLGSEILKVEEITMVIVISAYIHLSKFMEPVNFYCAPGNWFKDEVKSDIQVISIQSLSVKLNLGEQEEVAQLLDKFQNRPLWKAHAIAEKIFVKVMNGKIVLLIANEMLTGFSLKFLVVVQLLDEHSKLRESEIVFRMVNTSRSQGKNAQDIQNENNKVTTELFSGELILVQNINVLLASIVKYLCTVNSFSIVVSQYLPPVNTDCVTTTFEQKSFCLIILLGSSIKHWYEALKLCVIYSSARECVELLADVIFCTKYFYIGVLNTNQGCSYYRNALYCYLREVENDPKDDVVRNQLGILLFPMDLMRIILRARKKEKILHVKNTTTQPQPILFSARGIAQLKPEHFWLSFKYKRKVVYAEFIEEVVSKEEKSLDTNRDVCCGFMWTSESIRASSSGLLMLLIWYRECTCWVNTSVQYAKKLRVAMYVYFCIFEVVRDFKVLHESQDWHYLVVHTMSQPFKVYAKLDNNENAGAIIVKRLVHVWYWSYAVFVFDPGDFVTIAICISSVNDP